MVLEKHQYSLENLTWQVHVLSNWTRHAFGELNLQEQYALKTTLRNCLAPDMLLLKEQGVCGMLNLTTSSECCITIYPVTTSVEQPQAEMKEVTELTGDLFQSLQLKDWVGGSWLASLLKSLRLRGWGGRAWLMRIGLILLGGFIFLTTAIAIMCSVITQTLSSISYLFSPSVLYVEITT